MADDSDNMGIDDNEQIDLNDKEFEKNEEESLDCDESEQSGVTPKRKRALTHEYYLRSLKDVMSPHSPEDFLNRRKRRDHENDDGSTTPITTVYERHVNFSIKSKSAVLTSLSTNKLFDAIETPSRRSRVVEMSPLLKNSSFFRRKTFDQHLKAISLSSQKLNYTPYKGRITPLKY